MVILISLILVKWVLHFIYLKSEKSINISWNKFINLFVPEFVAHLFRSFILLPIFDKSIRDNELLRHLINAFVYLIYIAVVALILLGFIFY